MALDRDVICRQNLLKCSKGKQGHNSDKLLKCCKWSQIVITVQNLKLYKEEIRLEHLKNMK